MPCQQVQDAVTGMRVDWNEPDFKQARVSGGSSGSGGPVGLLIEVTQLLSAMSHCREMLELTIPIDYSEG